MGLAKPLWDLAKRSPLLLNPTFGKMSALVGGADADILAGSTLVEIKTRQQACIERDDVRQLLGYAILARGCEEMPRLSSVAVYFPRFGVLHDVPLPPHLDDGACRMLATRLGTLWQGRVAA